MTSTLSLTISQSGFAQKPSALQTFAERTEWKETGRYDEVQRLCPAFQKQYPKSVRCFSFGTSPEGRPLLAMAVGEQAYLTPTTKNHWHRPVVAFQGGIHAGEIDGKDAGFWLIRDILEGKTLPNVLERVTLLFIPVFNVDGHERFGPHGRPNQVGPEQMGWRVTAQNLNLNRDYLKVDAPEMKDMISLLNQWDPILYVDLHVTDGAKFQQDIGVLVEPSNAGPEKLRSVSAELTKTVMKDLTADGNLPVPIYPSFLEDDNPQSGIAARPARAAFSNGYWAYRNRIGVLVETHSWRPYAHRVKSTYNAMKSMIQATAEKGRDWHKAARETDKLSEQLIGQSFPLSYQNTKKTEIIAFKGYAYTRTLSPISGQLMTRYDDKKPEVWNIPLFSEVETKLSDTVPRFFFIPVAYKHLFEDRLKLHGIQYSTLTAPWQGKTKIFQSKITGPFKGPNESHQRIDYEGQWQATEGAVLAGSLKVDMNQARSRLAMLLLNPMSQDSLLAWGFLNQTFERKEYMESYVAEEIAVEMLKDPSIKKEFETKLKDPDFAKDPNKRLDFFAEKHPSYDQRFLKYPVLRVD